MSGSLPSKVGPHSSHSRDHLFWWIGPEQPAFALPWEKGGDKSIFIHSRRPHTGGSTSRSWRAAGPGGSAAPGWQAAAADGRSERPAVGTGCWRLKLRGADPDPVGFAMSLSTLGSGRTKPKSTKNLIVQ